MLTYINCINLEIIQTSHIDQGFIMEMLMQSSQAKTLRRGYEILFRGHYGYQNVMGPIHSSHFSKKSQGKHRHY